MNGIRHNGYLGSHSWPITSMLALAGLALVASDARGQGFSASVSPPRVELAAKQGQTIRQVLDINHAALTPGRYRVYTNDWTYQNDGSVSFEQDLKPLSCRPWVALERRDLTIQPKGRHRFRMEVSVPALAASGECRFAVMIEGVDPVQVQQAGLSMPVNGRIGVIVYVAVGDAKPQLSLAGAKVTQAHGAPTPHLHVTNRGDATGRLDGAVEGIDADGKKHELLPSNLPILPGETRWVALAVAAEEGKVAPTIKYPLKVKGSLEAGRERIAVDVSFNATP